MGRGLRTPLHIKQITMINIAIKDFVSVTGKHFNAGDVVPQGDATSNGKNLKQVDELSELWDKEKPEAENAEKPEANKVMTKKDLKIKTK